MKICAAPISTRALRNLQRRLMKIGGSLNAINTQRAGRGEESLTPREVRDVFEDTGVPFLASPHVFLPFKAFVRTNCHAIVRHYAKKFENLRFSKKAARLLQVETN